MDNKIRNHFAKFSKSSTSDELKVIVFKAPSAKNISLDLLWWLLDTETRQLSTRTFNVSDTYPSPIPHYLRSQFYLILNIVWFCSTTEIITCIYDYNFFPVPSLTKTIPLRFQTPSIRAKYVAFPFRFIQTYNLVGFIKKTIWTIK